MDAAPAVLPLLGRDLHGGGGQVAALKRWFAGERSRLHHLFSAVAPNYRDAHVHTAVHVCARTFWQSSDGPLPVLSGAHLRQRDDATKAWGRSCGTKEMLQPCLTRPRAISLALLTIGPPAREERGGEVVPAVALHLVVREARAAHPSSVGTLRTV